MVKDNDDDGKGAKKIEARLALAIAKARVDSERAGRCSFGDRFLNGGSVAFKSRNWKVGSGKQNRQARSEGNRYPYYTANTC